MQTYSHSALGSGSYMLGNAWPQPSPNYNEHNSRIAGQPVTKLAFTRQGSNQAGWVWQSHLHTWGCLLDTQGREGDWSEVF